MSAKSDRIARRAILASLGVGATVVAASAGTAGTEDTPHWRATLDPLDAWMELPGQHRFMFDSISPKGGGHALFFARNFFTANKEGYGLAPSALAVIIVLRAEATSIGYNDSIWKKYGKELSKILELDKVHMANPYSATGNGAAKRGVTFSDLAADGVHFAVCGMATKGLSGILAKQTHGNAEDIHKEIAANLIPNGHLVPAGIAAVNRAQERGYAFAFAG